MLNITSLLKLSSRRCLLRSYSYFSRGNLENVNQDIDKIAQGWSLKIFNAFTVIVTFISCGWGPEYCGYGGSGTEYRQWHPRL